MNTIGIGISLFIVGVSAVLYVKTNRRPPDVTVLDMGSRMRVETDESGIVHLYDVAQMDDAPPHTGLAAVAYYLSAYWQLVNDEIAKMRRAWMDAQYDSATPITPVDYVAQLRTEQKLLSGNDDVSRLFEFGNTGNEEQSRETAAPEQPEHATPRLAVDIATLLQLGATPSCIARVMYGRYKNCLGVVEEVAKITDEKTAKQPIPTPPAESTHAALTA